jgi:hypothetical protein
LTIPFWDAAERHELLIQYCPDSGRYQFYPRPFDLETGSDNVEWVQAKGTGTVYSLTEVHLKILDELDPPYQVAIVELDEGPRLLSNIVNGEAKIGDRVQVTWREREDAPPLPVFEPIA